LYFADHPAGTVVTTPGDHIKLLLAYLNDGSYNGHQLLKPETVREMLTPQAARTGGRQAGTVEVGLIWMLSNHGKPNYSFGHGGAHMFGWHNDFQAFPKLDFAVSIATNQWDMVLWSDPTWRTPMRLIEDFIASWITREKEGSLTAVPKASWAWKTSYVIGLIMAEQLDGLLETPSPITPEIIDAMARQGAEYAPGAGGKRTWDPAGFRAGMADMMAEKKTVPELRAFARSSRLKVLPEELYLLVRELRGRNGLPYVGL
jgi:hypothetical protein